MWSIFDNYFKIEDLDKHKKCRIKLVMDSKKKHVIILVYYIL